MKNKTPELLQAQAASFAAHLESEQGFDSVANAEAVYRRIGVSAVESSLDESENDLEQYDEYVQYLRGLPLNERVAIRERAEYLTKYETFASDIELLLGNKDKYREQRLGNGTHSEVFKIDKDGQQYVIRHVNPEKISPEMVVNRHLSSYIAAKEVPGLERVVAASFEKGVVVSEHVEGQKVGELSVQEVAEIPDEHLDELLQTRLDASQHGVQFDTHFDNLIYDVKSGFTDIDYGLMGERLDRIGAMRTVIASLELTAYELMETDASERAQHAAVKVALWSRLTGYIAEHFNEIEQKELRDYLVYAITRTKVGLAILGHTAT